MALFCPVALQLHIIPHTLPDITEEVLSDYQIIYAWMPWLSLNDTKYFTIKNNAAKMQELDYNCWQLVDLLLNNLLPTDFKNSYSVAPSSSS